MNFVLPPKSAVGAIDPEIWGEGEKAQLSDGENMSWTPPPEKLVMPDWSQIKSIRHYFGRKGGPVYPAWLFHPTEPDTLVKNAAEAAKLGVMYRKATSEERDRYGHESVWDWEPDSKWRPRPQRAPKFDPMNLGTGKIYQAAPHNPVGAQERLIESLIPAVAAAVAQSLKSTGPSAPASIDPKQWEAFLAFQAFQKTTETVNALTEEVDAVESNDHGLWVAEAERLGMKVDKRWSTERLKSEVLAKKAA